MTAPGRDFESSQATATGMLATADLARGDIIAGRYRIEEMLGIGGMGVVYRAHDQQLDVPVALKLLRPELAARPDAFARFRQELLLARQVSSPHVVRIHDLVQHGPLWLITMDYIPGASLEKRVDLQGPMDSEAALKIVRQVALGLSVAHDSMVVHRDLKPANILVTDAGEAFITDFGVARSAAQTGITGTGVVIGTPEYLSPEQARAETVDGRSDLYTLGLILYELIAGQLPFHGSTAAESLAQRIVRSPPPLKKVKPDVANWIDSLCGRLLALRPQHRLPNARAVVAAIDRRRVPPLPGRWKPYAAAAALVLALGAAGWWGWQRWSSLASQTASVPTLDVVLLPVRAPDEADAATRQFAAGLSTWLWSSLAASDQRSADPERMQVLLRQLDFDADSAARNPERVSDGLPSRRLLTPELVRVGEAWTLRVTAVGAEPGRAQELALPDEAAAAWTSGAALIGSEAPAWPGRAALTALGAPLDAKAAAPYDAALELAPHDGATWRAALTLADRRAIPNASATLAERALTALDAATTHDAVVARGYAQLLLGDPEAAAREFDARRALAPSDLPLHRLWARAQSDLDGPEAAIPLLQDVVRQDPQNARGWFLLGRYTFAAGDARRAVDEYLVRALVIAQRIGDEWGTAEARNAMGLCYERLGQTQAAIEHFTLAAGARERLGDALGAAASLRNLAAAESVRGDLAAAERALDRAGELLEGIDAPQAKASLLNYRGLLAEERGDFQAALSAYRDALSMRQAANDAARMAESQYNVGFAYYQLGEFDNAVVYWRQSEAQYATRKDEAGRLRAKESLALIDSARGAWNDARATLEQAVKDAEANQRVEEHAVGLTYLADLDRLQGRLGTAIEHAAEGAKFFAQREDLRGTTETALLHGAALLDAGDFAGAEALLAKIEIGEDGNDEQRALLALRNAQAQFGRGDLAAAADSLAQASAGAVAAHSQPVAIEADLTAARLALAQGQRAEALAALKRARSGLERYSPMNLSLLEAEAGLRLGEAEGYDVAQGLLRRAQDYGRAYAIHHAAARALADAGKSDAARAARERWQRARDALRTQLPTAMQAAFDALPEAQDPLSAP